MTLYSANTDDINKPGTTYKPAEYAGGAGRPFVKEIKVPQTLFKESRLRKIILENLQD